MEGSTCLSRLDGLRALGLDAEVLDTTAVLPPGPRLLRSLVQRTYFHPSVRRLNLQLESMVEKSRYDLVWVERGEWIYPWTLSRVRKQGCAIVHYNTDDVFGTHGHFWLHRVGMRNYDLYLTTNRLNVPAIRDRFGIRSVRVAMGFDPVSCRPSDRPAAKELDVVFVGHWEPHTEAYILALRAAGIDVRVWGRNWWKARDLALRNAVPLPHADYAATIARAKIALCSLSRWNRNESTGRSFEIPAIGTMLLAERTAEHEFIYGHGRGAVLFSTSRELVESARYYLATPTAREAIAAVGHELSTTPGHSWPDHIRREWPIIVRLLAQPGVNSEACEDSPFWPGFRNGVAPPHSSSIDRNR